MSSPPLVVTLRLMAMRSSIRRPGSGLTRAAATSFDGRMYFARQEQRAPSPRQNRALGAMVCGTFFCDVRGTQYVFHVFPRRFFGEASFFSETSFFDHEKSRWHAGRMPRATPKPWRTLAPSSSRNLQPMIDMPICRGPMSSDAASRKRGSSVILE